MKRLMLVIGLVPAALAAQPNASVPDILPAAATLRLARSLEDARPHARHVWRDTPPLNPDGTVNAYVEIPRGDRRKWELSMAANARAIDRVLPAAVGGYPVNYGFVPQTVSYDGDPFDVLVLGPAVQGGRIVRGVVVGLMHMDDEKGLDSKVVVSAADGDGRPLHTLTADEQHRIAKFFQRYKLHEAGKHSTVPGWGTIADGLSFVTTTHAFFTACRAHLGRPCRIAR